MTKPMVRDVPRMSGMRRKERRRVQVDLTKYGPRDAAVRAGKAQVGDPVPCLVQSSPAKSCDIKTIVAKYAQTGVYGHVSKVAPQYGDYSELPPYDDALQAVVKAQHVFDSMPAEVRDRFANDPARMISFLEDPKNKDEAVKLGLFKKPESPPPAAAPPAEAPEETPK